MIHFCGWRGDCAGEHKRVELDIGRYHITIALNKEGCIQKFNRKTQRYNNELVWISIKRSK